MFICLNFVAETKILNIFTSGMRKVSFKLSVRRFQSIVHWLQGRMMWQRGHSAEKQSMAEQEGTITTSSKLQKLPVPSSLSISSRLQTSPTQGGSFCYPCPEPCETNQWANLISHTLIPVSRTEIKPAAESVPPISTWGFGEMSTTSHSITSSQKLNANYSYSKNPLLGWWAVWYWP